MAAASSSFSWTDGEIEACLQSALEFKAVKEFLNVDWETCRTKYEDISKIMEKEKDVKISKERVAAKLKKIRLKFREAIDRGKKSGGGRIVTEFYDLCSSLWGASPAVTCIQNGKLIHI